MTIYHRLMDADAYRDKTIPSPGSLYEEGQALMFGGADTVGNTLMVGTFHLLKDPARMQKLKTELQNAWPSLNGREPKVKELEALPYLNAVIKESLRISSGVISGLLRVVPGGGAMIAGVQVPSGVSPPSNHMEFVTDVPVDHCFDRQHVHPLQFNHIRRPRAVYPRALVGFYRAG